MLIINNEYQYTTLSKLISKGPYTQTNGVPYVLNSNFVMTIINTFCFLQFAKNYILKNDKIKPKQFNASCRKKNVNNIKIIN